jgi:biopolymer transport protein ExbD
MAAKKQNLDVWVVETNTVYKQVPFTVIVDWVQQGRLLENDMLRPAGATEWQPLSSLTAFAAYLPKVEPYRAEDQAEALEPVQVDFAWKPASDYEEEDVDMIPLIDVSLVLLIFFMMTASVASSQGGIDTPRAQEGTLISSDARMVWIGIDRGADGEPIYSIGQGAEGPTEGDNKLNQKEVLARLDERLKTAGRVDVRIKGHRELPIETIKQMTMLVGGRPGVGRIYAEVSESTNP